MDGSRKAALLLSSLREEDRAWLLARVDDSQRTRLAPLLSEVRGLGVSVDPRTLRELAQSDGDAQEPEADDSASASITSASASAVLEALGGEPDWLIAIVLRARPWPWREALLNLLGTERRSSIQKALPSGVEVQPRVIETLVAAIEARLDERAAGWWRDSKAPRGAARLRGAVGNLLKRGVRRWRS